MIRRHRFFPLLWGAALFCAAPTFARAKPSSQTAQKPPAATPAKAPIPLMIGIGIGALALGGALGFALKKPKVAVAAATQIPDLFDELPFPLVYVNENEKLTRRNPAFQRFFGVESATFPELFHPDDLTEARAHLHDILGGQRQNFSRPYRFFGADGALFHAVLSGQKGGNARSNNAVLLALRDTTAQASAEVELSGAREAISALYSVIAGDKSRDLDGKIKSLLAMGCGRFELPIGALGRFSGDDFETLFVQSADRRVRPAMTLSRMATSGEAALLGLDSLPNRANWKNFPFVTKNEGVSYLGAPVLVESELFGMLSFSGLEARSKPFAAGEIELLQLMADWVGGEIERENTKTSLEKQQKALLEANDKLEALATHDALTGTKNRRAFTEKLEEEWSRARRYGTPLSLVMFDVDKFKLYNDSFGHPAGDEVLKRVARILMAAIRGTDFAARYGGEEFVLILPNTDADGAMILAQRLRQKIESAPWKERQVTASLGVSSILPIHKVAADLLSAADGALYHSKENGRNRVTHTRDMEVLPDSLQDLEQNE
ncbi:PAS domain S-box-containing protein/diguanylate cyclase (GGDEF) domain-containing protein [Abditibacterium utsteinense]|uniref:diguanylate cyclase n=1 Tax=Abditibacterium utsteinense TaxID=1960156 RepID=A0A2S8SQT2_9BACT|nr:diguanylate cyclase [Abditibacterium utsteinense]PQV63150.1 PAS domain S-box-containing protein/diguanylate cyclase (GGDEF) domain-containing protein [Abditibacterium utsteinense]